MQETTRRMKETGADEMAINQKLFSIRAVGDSARIVNVPDFESKVF